jgi:outer membrane protein OmpA-like peptidoglycan-associated protein
MEAQSRLEAEQQAQRESEAAQLALAELKRKQAAARAPRAEKVHLPPSIEAQPLEPKAAPQPASIEKIPEVQPKPVQRVNPSAFAWQLSDDLRQLHAQTDVQTLYNEKGWVVSLGAEAFFAPGEAELRTDAEPALDKLARLLRHYAARGILMEGPDAARAQAVKRALTARGIPAKAIAANGTGERIEFVVPQ